MKMAIKARTLFAVGCAALLVGGCINLGPDYQRPEVVDDVPVAFRQEVIRGPEVPYDDQWWRIFDKPELNKVVKTVIANNWDIQRTAGRVLELRALAQVIRADRFPEVNVDWQYRTEIRKVKKSGSNGRSRETFRFYDLSLPLFFEVDLWGRFLGAGQPAP